MPELPEVETVRRDLASLVTGRVISGFHSTWGRALGGVSPEVLAPAVVGQPITGVIRRGKYLGLELGSGLVVVVHLKMTGRLLIAGPEASEPPRWVQTWFDFEDGGHLWFQDARKFGRIWLARDITEAAGKLGPEPMDPAFTPAYLEQALAKRSAPVKPLLLQQDIVAGIGNIYADESLFAAGIDPHRPASSLKKREIVRLHRAIRQVIRRAIGHRGSSMDDFLDAHGQQGFYKPHLKVYGRKGLPCLVCGTTLQGETLRQRSAVWCPRCQR